MAAGITYVPPLLLEAGVEERYMTMVLGKGLVKTKEGAGSLVTQASLQNMYTHTHYEVIVCICVHGLLLPNSFSNIYL